MTEKNRKILHSRAEMIHAYNDENDRKIISILDKNTERKNKPKYDISEYQASVILTIDMPFTKTKG